VTWSQKIPSSESGDWEGVMKKKNRERKNGGRKRGDYVQGKYIGCKTRGRRYFKRIEEKCTPSHTPEKKG